MKSRPNLLLAVMSVVAVVCAVSLYCLVYVLLVKVFG